MKKMRVCEIDPTRFNNIIICHNGCGKIIHRKDTRRFELTTGKSHVCNNFVSNSEASTSLEKRSDAISSDGRTLKFKGKNARRKRRSFDNETRRILDAIFIRLVNIQTTVKTPDGKLIPICKYYNQAWNILRDVREGDIQNPFIIYMSDLGLDLIRDLLDSHNKDYILFKIVEKIFKNCNLSLYEKVKKEKILQYEWIFL